MVSMVRISGVVVIAFVVLATPAAADDLPTQQNALGAIKKPVPHHLSNRSKPIARRQKHGSEQASDVEKDPPSTAGAADGSATTDSWSLSPKWSASNPQ